MSNRGVVWCLDIKGFRDGKNDGPVTDEKLTGPHDADVIWSFDMMEEVGVVSAQHVELVAGHPGGDLMYVSTSNGQDESHVHIPSPKAPAIIALNKNTGKLVWEDNSVEDRILHGQWSTPSVGKIGGVDQVVSAQGDGWVRGYEALTGKKLWEFDTNPKDSVWPKNAQRGDRDAGHLRGRVYIANGQDPEHGEGVGHFYAIDATKRGDITQTGRVWHFDKIRRSISTAAIADGLLYIPDFSGFLHCLDAKTGQEYWTHDMFAAVWGSTLVVDGKVYLGDEDGDVVVLQAGKEKKVLAEMNMGSAVYATPVPAHGALFINNRNQLFALAVRRKDRYVATSNGDLVAIDLASGKLRWKYATGGIIGESSPAVGGGQVFFGDLGGTVHAVSAADGSRRWTFKTGGEVKSSPTLAGDLVLIGSYDTNLYALDSRTGKVRWKLQTDGPVHATAAVHGDVVYITGCDERLRGLRLATGAVIFTLTTGAYTGASPLVDVEKQRAYFGTFNYEVLGVDLRTKKIAWRYRNPDREFPFYSSAARRRPRHRRRPRQDRARHRRGDRQRRRGRSRRRRASIRRRRLPEGASTSARPTGVRTVWTQRAARSSGSSMRARESRPLPRLHPAVWSSALRDG